MNILIEKKSSMFFRIFAVGAVAIIVLSSMMIVNAAIEGTLTFATVGKKTSTVASTTYADEVGYNQKVIVVVYSGANQTGNILATANGESAGTAWVATDYYEGVKSAYSKHEVCYPTGGVYKKITKTKNK